MCLDAAENGHLDMLKWARRQFPLCPWDWQTTAMAAEKGHLDVLMWAHKHGCPSHAKMRNFVNKGGHLDVIEWLDGVEANA